MDESGGDAAGLQSAALGGRRRGAARVTQIAKGSGCHGLGVGEAPAALAERRPKARGEIVFSLEKKTGSQGAIAGRDPAHAARYLRGRCPLEVVNRKNEEPFTDEDM